MSTVTVYVPTPPNVKAPLQTSAPRGDLPEAPVLTLVENGKPHARDLLQLLADELRTTYPQLEVDVFSKASAGKPLDGDDAKVIAARSHMVITGVGD